MNTHLSANELLISEIDRQSSAWTHVFVNKTVQSENKSERSDAEWVCFHLPNDTGLSQRMSDAPPDLGPKTPQDVDVEAESGALSQAGEVR